jgi:hypothetical protein
MERCEYYRSGYCGYFSVTGCQRPCGTGESCDFFGSANGRKKPGKPKKQIKTETETAAPGKKSKQNEKTVVIYVDGAPGPVRLRGDCIIPGKDRICVLQGNDLVGFVRDDDVLMVYIEEAAGL